MPFLKNNSNKTGGDAGGILSSTNGTILKTGVFNPYLLKLRSTAVTSEFKMSYLIFKGLMTSILTFLFLNLLKSIHSTMLSVPYIKFY